MVTVTVFAGVLDLLEQVYGPRTSDPSKLNTLFSMLGEVEVVYKSLPSAKKAVTKIAAGKGYTIVHWEAVTANGHHFRDDLDITDTSSLALLFPNGRAAMGDGGRWPYRYESVAEAKADAEVLHTLHAGQEVDQTKGGGE